MESNEQCEHSDNINKYCESCNIFICSSCLKKDHSKHLNKIKSCEILSSELKAEVSNMIDTLTLLDEMKDVQNEQNMIQDVENYYSNLMDDFQQQKQNLSDKVAKVEFKDTDLPNLSDEVSHMLDVISLENIEQYYNSSKIKDFEDKIKKIVEEETLQPDINYKSIEKNLLERYIRFSTGAVKWAETESLIMKRGNLSIGWNRQPYYSEEPIPVGAVLEMKINICADSCGIQIGLSSKNTMTTTGDIWYNENEGVDWVCINNWEGSYQNGSSGKDYPQKTNVGDILKLTYEGSSVTFQTAQHAPVQFDLDGSKSHYLVIGLWKNDDEVELLES